MNGSPTLPSHFAIHHYAGTVIYDSKGFVQKNVDQLSDYLKALLANSSSPLVAHLFEVYQTPYHIE